MLSNILLLAPGILGFEGAESHEGSIYSTILKQWPGHLLMEESGLTLII